MSSDLDAYKNAYLYALAILLDVDIPSLNLSGNAADAACGLAEVLGGCGIPCGSCKVQSASEQRKMFGCGRKMCG